MKHRFFLILVCVVAALSSCTQRSENGRVPQPTDTLYTRQAAMLIYAYQPDRALLITDSAVIVGNLSEWEADENRARIYSSTQMRSLADSLLGGPTDVRLDTAKAICLRLLKHDSILADPKRQQDVLEILTYTERMQNDTLGWLEHSRALAEVCRQVGELATYDGLRTEAEIGAALCALGQMEPGMAKMDSVIAVLSNVRTFAALDALIIASKRKIVILGSHSKYAETLPVAHRIIDRLDDYEANPDLYHDGSHREPPTDDKRAGYIRFYRGQAMNYITAAYTALSEQGGMLAAFRQIEEGTREATVRENLARYNALQQQMEAERQKAIADRNSLIAIASCILSLLVIVCSIILVRVNRSIRHKNSVLVQQFTDAAHYKELYQNEKKIHEPQPAVSDLNTLSDEQLFRHINEVVTREKLFLDPNFGRQTIIERFHLSKERVGAIFSKGSDYSKLSDYIQQLRMEYAAKLLVDNPQMTIVQIASDCGFSSHKYFTERFHHYYSMTPTEFREAKM